MDGHPPTKGWSPTKQGMVTHQKEVYLRLGIWHLDFTFKTNIRLQLPCLVPHNPQDGHPLLQGWSSTIQNMVTNLPKGGHPFYK